MIRTKLQEAWDVAGPDAAVSGRNKLISRVRVRVTGRSSRSIRTRRTRRSCSTDRTLSGSSRSRAEHGSVLQQESPCDLEIALQTGRHQVRSIVPLRPVRERLGQIVGILDDDLVIEVGAVGVEGEPLDDVLA